MFWDLILKFLIFFEFENSIRLVVFLGKNLVYCWWDIDYFSNVCLVRGKIFFYFVKENKIRRFWCWYIGFFFLGGFFFVSVFRFTFIWYFKYVLLVEVLIILFKILDYWVRYKVNLKTIWFFLRSFLDVLLFFSGI